MFAVSLLPSVEYSGMLNTVVVKLVDKYLQYSWLHTSLCGTSFHICLFRIAVAHFFQAFKHEITENEKLYVYSTPLYLCL